MGAFVAFWLARRMGVSPEAAGDLIEVTLARTTLAKSEPVLIALLRLLRFCTS